MGLSEQDRHKVLISHEGQILAHVGTCGVEMTGDLARCYADGAINAIIRLEGAEAATRFAFALSDRAAGGLRGETLSFPLPSAPPPEFGLEPEHDSALAAVAAALEDDSEDDYEPPPARTVPRQGLPVWFLYWVFAIAAFVGWIVGHGVRL